MTTQTRTASERLKDWLDVPLILLLDEALAAEYQRGVADGMADHPALAARTRRATVERIRERLNGRGTTRWSTLAHQQDDPDAPEWALDESMVLAILDEEAAR